MVFLHWLLSLLSLWLGLFPPQRHQVEAKINCELMNFILNCIQHFLFFFSLLSLYNLSYNFSFESYFKILIPSTFLIYSTEQEVSPSGKFIIVCIVVSLIPFRGFLCLLLQMLEIFLCSFCRAPLNLFFRKFSDLTLYKIYQYTISLLMRDHFEPITRKSSNRCSRFGVSHSGASPPRRLGSIWCTYLCRHYLLVLFLSGFLSLNFSETSAHFEAPTY